MSWLQAQPLVDSESPRALQQSLGIQQPVVEKVAASLGGLLPIVAPATMLGLALVAASRWLIQPDTWVALATGRVIANHGLPSVERLTLLAQGRRWVDQQ